MPNAGNECSGSLRITVSRAACPKAPTTRWRISRTWAGGMTIRLLRTGSSTRSELPPCRDPASMSPTLPSAAASSALPFQRRTKRWTSWNDDWNDCGMRNQKRGHELHELHEIRRGRISCNSWRFFFWYGHMNNLELSRRGFLLRSGGSLWLAARMPEILAAQEHAHRAAAAGAEVKLEFF